MSARKQLRPRHLYVKPAGEWVGFGVARNDEPDLFETIYRAGWWHVHVCRVCIVDALKKGSALVEQAEAILTQPRRVKK